MEDNIQIWNTALAVQYPGDLGIEISLFQDSSLVISGLPIEPVIEVSQVNNGSIHLHESPTHGIDLFLDSSNNIDVKATGTILYHPTNVYLPEVKTYLSNSNDLTTLYIGNHALSQIFASINHTHDNIYDPGHTHDDRYPTFSYLNSWFELVNPGTENEYLRVKKTIAGDKEIQAWTDTGWLPPNIWAAMPSPSSTARGGILLGNTSLPTKFLREDGNWQVVTSGTMDHNALSNKDYASSGHIGFLPDTHLLDFAHSNIATAYNHAISSHNYDPAGSAEGARTAHESAYNHANYNAGYTHSQTVHNAAFVGLGNVPNINFSAWFEIVNAGQTNEYLRCKKPLAGDYEIQAWTDNGQFPAETIAGIQKVAGGTRYLREDGTWQTVISGGGSWGSITGTLSNQTDLQSALNAKSDIGHSHAGMVTGTPWRTDAYLPYGNETNGSLRLFDWTTNPGRSAFNNWYGITSGPTADSYHTGFTSMLSDTNYGFQIAAPVTTNERLFFRKLGGGTFGGWKELFSSASSSIKLNNSANCYLGMTDNRIIAHYDMNLYNHLFFVGADDATLGTGGISATALSLDSNVVTVAGGMADAPTATPGRIHLGNSFSNGETSDKLKLIFHDGGYGLSVGSSADMQYHSAARHDFFVSNTRRMGVQAGGLYLFNATAGTGNSNTLLYYNTSTGQVTYSTVAGVWTSSGAWKPASLSSMVRVIGITGESGASEFALATLNGRMYPYCDGWFYQDEGQYRVVDEAMLQGNGYNYSGQNHYYSNRGAGTSLLNANSPALQAFCDDSGAAFMSFHRSNVYAINVGLDNDNRFKIGGWSAGTWLNIGSTSAYVPGSMYADEFRSTGNHGGTGEAAWFPVGIYSAGTNWIYGSTYHGGGNVYSVNQLYFDTSGATNSNYVGTIDSYNLTMYCGRGNGCRLTLSNDGTSYFSGAVSSGSISVTGTITVSSVVTASNFQLSSDSRLKLEPKPLNPKRLDITYREYEMISEPGIKRFGVIAQEIEKKYPELVRTGDDGYKSVSYVDLIIREIAFLKERIEYFERR
jgi:hypothetical protein